LIGRRHHRFAPAVIAYETFFAPVMIVAIGQAVSWPPEESVIRRAV
jgi:hypothetical protein